MAPSQVSGMKMRNLLFGVILGLLAVVHSTPVNIVTQIPTKAEDDVFREAMTDGFLIDHFLLPSLTTESPKRNTTIQASQLSSSDSQSRDIIEGSAEGETSVKSTTSVFLQRGGEHYPTTTQSVSHAQSSTSAVLPRDAEDTSSDSSTSSSMTSSSNTETSAASSTSMAAPQMFAESEGSGSGSKISEEFSAFAGSEGPGSGSESRSGMSEERVEREERVSTVFAGPEGPGSESKSRSGISEERVEREERVSTVFAGPEGPGSVSESGSGSGISEEIPATEKKSRLMKYPFTNGQKEKEPKNPPSAQNNGHSTPGWIIILGFIVGVAALVMLCVAIATRDKWNGPNQASQPETKTNSSNQQRELEMETFLHKDNPRENGKAEEYTVIPLDELPEKYFSH